MNIDVSIHKLKPNNPFRIARGEKRFVENVFIQIEHDGITGYGEASPNKFYNERAQDVATKLSGIKEFLSDKGISSIDEIINIWQQAWPLLNPSRAAQCALDIALWDTLGKKMNMSVSQLLWGKSPEKLTSSCTLGICDPPDWEKRFNELAGCPIIKIKMDGRGDLDFLRYIRSRTDATIRVDANCSWGELDITDMSHRLKNLGIEFIEQPLPPEENPKMSAVLKSSPLPIIADESSIIPEDIEKLKDRFSGINIKLVKCGGITPGREMLGIAKEQGFKVMIGCMLESNLLISAGAALGQKADYIDLDGSWLLKDKVFGGITFQSGILTLSEKNGLGVWPLGKLV